MKTGKIVRYFEAGHSAHYFGSSSARDRVSGRYERDREGRAIASTAKMLGAVLIANDGEDTLGTKYLDTKAPSKGVGNLSPQGTITVACGAPQTVFACSMSEPLATRLVQAGAGNRSPNS